MNTFKRQPGPRILTVLLALLAVALLWPPGPYSPRAYAQEQPTAAPRIFVPLVSGVGGTGAPAPTPVPPTPQPTPQPSPPTTVPDLRFTPDAVTLDPGAETMITVRVEPAADLRGASFELPGVPDGVTSSFAAAADGTSGTLTLSASAALEADARMLTVQGRSGIDTSKTWVGALRITTTATLTAKTIFVDAVNGKDANAGTQAAPVKTLATALTKVVAGDTVKLLPGSYDKTHSGDTYPVLVPHGVTIAGTLQANGAKATFLAPSSSAAGETGLTFAGDAAIKDLELDVFSKAIETEKGKLSLTNLSFIFNRTNLDVGGTAQATLTNNAFLINPNPVDLTAIVSGQAQLIIDGGKVEGSGPNCIPANTVGGILTFDSAHVTLKNHVALTNIPGLAFLLRGASKTTLDGVTVSRDNPTGCQLMESIRAIETSSLTVKNAHLSMTGGQFNEHIRWGSTAALTVTTSAFEGNGTVDGIVGEFAAGPITVSGSTFFGNATGITAGAVVVNSSTMAKNSTAVSAVSLKLRNSLIFENQQGVRVRNTADLGTVADPGGNIVKNNALGLSFFDPTISTTVQAVGNTWNPNVQGADAVGRYTTRRLLDSTQPDARNGTNFSVPSATIKVQL